MIRIVLVDDQPLVRAGLRALAERDGDIEVVGEAADGATVVTIARRTHPDVALMDLRMPGVDGIEATRRMLAADARVRVLVLTTFDDDERIAEAIRAGASGYLLKDVEPGALRDGIRRVAGGDALLAPAIQGRVMRMVASAEPQPATDPSRLAGLTERELEVLAAVGRGRTNDEIAAELYLSPATARTYVSRLLSKLGARDRAALIVLCYDTGLVAPGE